MSLAEQTDQVAQAVALLISQFKGRDGIEGLVESYAAQLQEIEAMFFDLLENRALATAVGAQLDGIGRIVLLGRDGRDDATYRAALGIKILIMKNSGLVTEIRTIIAGLVADTYDFFVKTSDPTSVDIEFSADVGDTPTPLVVAKQVREFIAAGVRVVVAWDDFFGVGGRTYPFSFGPGDEFFGADSLGFANAAGTTGGYFIRASDGRDPATQI